MKVKKALKIIDRQIKCHETDGCNEKCEICKYYTPKDSERWIDALRVARDVLNNYEGSLISLDVLEGK